MRSASLCLLFLAGCGSSPAPAAPTPEATRASPPRPVQAVATTPRAPDACTPIRPESAAFFTQLGDLGRASTDHGAARSEQIQLFRHLTVLHEGGVVRSIVPTGAKGPHGPMFALTLLRRNAEQKLVPTLAFATAPCAGGEPALVSPPMDLPGADAVIDRLYTVPSPEAAPLADVRVEVFEEPLSIMGETARGARRMAMALVGASRAGLTVTTPRGAPFGVLGMIPSLDAELPPEPGTSLRRHDRHLLGTRWFPLADGAAFLLVHHLVPDADDRCVSAARTGGKPIPIAHAPPRLRLLARVGPRGFVVEPSQVGTAFLVGIPDSQPTEAMTQDKTHLLGYGPSGNSERYFVRSRAQWLWGMFVSAEEASSTARARGYKAGVILATEPPPGVPPPKEPWIVPSEPPAKSGFPLDCAGF